jgi:hypothetical protein
MYDAKPTAEEQEEFRQSILVFPEPQAVDSRQAAA